jgi:hypothetical protein
MHKLIVRQGDIEQVHEFDKVTKWLSINQITDKIKPFIVDEKSFVVYNEVISLFKVNEEWAAQNLDLLPSDELVPYKVEKICIKPEVRGPVKVLAKYPVYGEYGDEIFPAIYTMAKDGVVSPAVYKGYEILIDCNNGELIINEFTR